MTKGSNLHTSQSVPLLFQAVPDVEDTSSISNDEEFIVPPVYGDADDFEEDEDNNSCNDSNHRQLLVRKRRKQKVGTRSYTTLSTAPLEDSYSSEEDDEEEEHYERDIMEEHDEEAGIVSCPSQQQQATFNHPYDHRMPLMPPHADYEDEGEECMQVVGNGVGPPPPVHREHSHRHTSSRRKNSTTKHKSRRKRRQGQSSTTTNNKGGRGEKGSPSESSSEQIKNYSIKLIHIVKSLFIIWAFGMVGLVVMDSYQNPLSNTNGSGSVVSPVSSKFKSNGLPDNAAPLFPLMGGGQGVKHIPLPLPPNKVSVVIMNYSRPRMIQESSLMSRLLAHPNIDEVVILHANPKAAFKFVHPKVVNIDASRENDEMGLSLRFYYCQLMKNKWVIHVDDDMEFSSKALSEMLIEFAKNSKRIVGRYGRDLSNTRFNGYNSASTHGSTEVILTKLMVMERDTCSAFFEYSHLVWEDTVLNSGDGPLWNGEDIFMSLVANHVYGATTEKNNYAMDWLDVWDAPESLKDYDNGKLDISGRIDSSSYFDFHWWRCLMKRDRHYSYRGSFWQIAKARLAESR